jgi:hypothetical protein
MLVGALIVGICSVPAAHAVQASGSIQLVPSQQINLAKDQQFTVDVFFVNNSTTTPPGAVVANPANVKGPITLDYTCTDTGCDCSTKDNTRLSFVSCSIAGAPAGVTSCTAGGPGQVVIDTVAGGVDLAASTTPVFLATVTLKNNSDPLLTTRFRAATDVCALSSCLTVGADCALCAAEGCTFVRGPNVPNTLLSCKHGCPNRISFYNGLDKLHFNTVVQAPTYDPATDSFMLTLTLGASTVYTLTLPNVPQVGTRVYRLFGPGNSSTPGLESIEITRRTGTGIGGVDCTMDWFKVIVDAWGDFNIAQVTDPKIQTEMTLDALPAFTDSEQWTSIPSGAVGGAIRAVQLDFAQRSPC